MLALVVTWGAAFVAIKDLGAKLDPYQLTWFRYLPFLLVYGAWLPLARRARFRDLSGRDWLLVLAAGTLGVIGYHFPLNWGLHGPGGIGAGAGAILIATTPLWTMLFAVTLRQERFERRRALGSLVAFAGVGVIVFLAPVGGADVSGARKALVALVAPVSWALYSIVAKPLIHKHGSLFTTGLTLCVGTLALVPLGVDYGVEPLRDLTAAEAWTLIFLSLLSTVAGYTVWNLCLRRRSATEITVWIYLIPVVATLAGWLALGEAVTAWFALGALLVLAGVVQVNRARAAPLPDPPTAAPPAPPAPKEGWEG